MYLILFLAVLSFYLFYAINRKRRLKHEQRRERFQQKQEALVKKLASKK